MATYAIGDIQGCYFSLQRLLGEIKFNAAHDKLWLVGDLVNRGTGSLEVLRWVYEHQSSIVTVLGNHDLHAIMVGHGFAKAHKSDTLQALFESTDGDKLLNWLRHQHMAYQHNDYLLVHAGVLPQWTANEALALAGEVEIALRASDYKRFLAQMYGNLPSCWDAKLAGLDRLRVITNALTRLRICNAVGEMEFKFKGALANIPNGLMPWFDVPERKSKEATLVFGHWSALGLQQRQNLYALDTGCLWNGALTALRLEDKAIFQVFCEPEDGPLNINFAD